MVESGKEKPMPPVRPSDEPVPKAINRLMKDFQGSDKKASKCGFEALVRLGSPRWAAAMEEKTVARVRGGSLACGDARRPAVWLRLWQWHAVGAAL
jgi:hypothetical protein